MNKFILVSDLFLCYARGINLLINKVPMSLFEPGHEKMCLMSYANNKAADQPAHPGSLISAFVIHCLDSIISLDSVAKIARL